MPFKLCSHLRAGITGLCMISCGAAAFAADDTAAMEHFFDGSLRGDAGEASVDRTQGPEYYHFTLQGLSKFASLHTLRVSVIPHEGHASRRLDMRVWTSLPTAADEEVPGFDFSFRDETGLSYRYYDADGGLIEAEVVERDINQTGWIEVPLDGLSMEDARSFRMSFDHGFRGALSMPYVEVTGILEEGGEAVTLVRYDFDREGSRAVANQVHEQLEASILWPQGFPLPKPIVSVERPEGAYTAVRLQFSIPEAPESYQDWVLFGGMRNDTMPVDHWVRVSEPGGVLTRDGERFSGTFERQHRGEQPHTLRIDASIDGTSIRGTVTLTDDNPWNGTGAFWTGTVTGTLTPEAVLRSANAIRPETAWPRFTGPTGAGNTAEVRNLRTINSLEDIRLQWGSEAIDIGQGIGSLNRFAFRYSAARKRSGGGSSSPLVVDGKVYLYYAVPSPRRYNYFFRARNFAQGHGSFERDVVGMAEQGEARGLFSGGPEALPVAVLEKIWEAADDVVICMDAATGQTLWRTRIENVGYNRQHHKAGPYNQTPAVHGDRIFAIGSGGWLHALDRNTGEALWHQRVGGEHSHQSQAVLAIEEAVIIPRDDRWAALDPATGAQLWRNPDYRIHNVSIPAFWRADDGTPVILVYENTRTVAALNAATGDTLFTFALPGEDGFKETRFATGSGRAGNPNNMTLHGNALVTHERFHHENSDEDRWAVAVYDLSLEGLTPRWRYETEWIRGEWSPLVVQNRWVVTSPSPRGIMAFDLHSGELISEAGQEAAQTYTPGSNGLLMAMEDLIISQRDMTHGDIEITFFKIDENGQLTNLNPDRHMPLASGRGTGSYHHPVMQAVADGRLFMRERRGIMSYDLRAGE
ncbi:MAG: PQQ-binding-like beta-propeller repeat protein [Verrucomicrobia bacterium]|nr:PQQ-binding-like beta-propeller repeat protein [Verrucomicrobiota bacterium]MCH8512726.1 PQQ-binding-like beta-propeller repeat protein [Kiritimatiellia bacterium]